MINKDNAAVLLGMAAIIATLGIGTCSTNSRIDDTNRRMDNGFNNLERRMEDGFENVHRRIDDTNERIDEVQADIREIRTMLFEVLKDRTPAD
ncbi:MAG: hypothetical protein F4137_23365 [Acidobacteria bacterium]|nr:hypothetical protein [Acidobacteriota bacterium]